MCVRVLRSKARLKNQNQQGVPGYVQHTVCATKHSWATVVPKVKSNTMDHPEKPKQIDGAWGGVELGGRGKTGRGEQKGSNTNE